MVHFSHKTSKRKMWFFYEKPLIFIGNDKVLNSKFTMAKELSLLFTPPKKKELSLLFSDPPLYGRSLVHIVSWSSLTNLTFLFFHFFFFLVNSCFST